MGRGAASGAGCLGTGARRARDDPEFASEMSERQHSLSYMPKGVLRLAAIITCLRRRKGDLIKVQNLLD
jgi:hypothetical protein